MYTHTAGSGSATRSGYAGGLKSENGATVYAPHATTSGSYSSVLSRSNSGPATYTPGGVSVTPRITGERNATYNIPSSAVASTSSWGGSKLTVDGSQSLLRQVNSKRAGLAGVNAKPIPQGQITVQPNGRLIVSADNGRRFTLRPDGTLASVFGDGVIASFNGKGRLTTLHTAGMTILRDPSGRSQRTVKVPLANNGLIVSRGPHYGYVQRQVAYGGQTYTQRTYLVAGNRYSRVYSPYSYHGRTFYYYVTVYYYPPAFYNWAFSPWASPVFYSWDWLDDPWYASYGDYFSPWPAYDGGANWLADYYLSQTLAAAYAMQPTSGDRQVYSDPAADDAPENQASAQADTPISRDIRQAIADEVRQQLANDNADAAQPDKYVEPTDMSRITQPNRVFVVDQPLNAYIGGQMPCGLSGGDTLRLVRPPTEVSVSDTAYLMVVSNRRGDCPAGTKVSVSLDDLQEMQNNFRAQLDSGLEQLREQQGHSGLPGAPQSAIAPPSMRGPDVPADPENVQALLKTQQQQANQAESHAAQLTFASQP
jgi:hypothetical protein